MGTGDIAIPSFSALCRSELTSVVGLVTQPDKPVGRKQVMTPPEIKSIASEQSIPVFQPDKVRDEVFLRELAALEPDVIVVMAYGQILSQELLDIPKLACINLHASLLPKYRGAACIQAAIDAGDKTTGITVMHVVKQLDAGDIILQKEISIGEDETGGELHDRLAELAPEVMMDALQLLSEGKAPRKSQDPECVSYVSKLMRSDGEIDWTMTATQLERRIRAYDPWPGTSTQIVEKKGKRKGRSRRLKIFPPVEVVRSDEEVGSPGEVVGTGETIDVTCGQGVLKIKNLQPDGARRMSAEEFLRSAPVEVGDRLLFSS